MKILRLTTLLDFGGIESKMINLSTYSDENEWLFCAIGKGGFAEEKIKQNNKNVKCFNLPYSIPSFITIVKLFSYFKKNKPDVVHSSGAEANFHGTIAAKLAGIKVVITEEIGIPKHSKIAILIFNWIYKKADFVLGESQNVVDYLKANYTINQDKLKVVSNFTLFSNTEHFKTKIISDEFKIVSISRLEPVKNIEGIIRVIHLLKNEKYKIKYTIVGDGSLQNKIQSLINELNLVNEIQLVGFQREPLLFLYEADLYLLNSFSEGFSNSLLEAMYCKTPSISTNVGAANEIISEGITGWIVTPDSETELFDKIKFVMSLPESSRIQIGKNAHNTVIEKYSVKSHVKALLKLYNT